MKIKDLDANLIDSAELKKNPNIKTLKMSFIKYKKKNLVVQLPNISLSSYGVPKLDQFHTQEQRNYFKLPIDPDSEMYKIFCCIDDRLKGSLFNSDIFGDKHEKYEYSSIVKYPNNGGPPYIKVKLLKSHQDNEIEAELFNNGDIIEYNNIDDFAKFVKFKSDVKCLVKFTKLWNVNNKYCITLTLLKLDCTWNDFVNDDNDDGINFLDSDDD